MHKSSIMHASLNSHSSTSFTSFPETCTPQRLCLSPAKESCRGGGGVMAELDLEWGDGMRFSPCIIYTRKYMDSCVHVHK